MIKHLDIRIFGEVQGVGFRYEARQEAIRLGLTGLVRNEDDRQKSVYLEVEGEENKLVEFVAWCHRGSGWASVSEVTVQENKIKNFSDFKIERGY